jgi:hypothetical protein
MIAEYRKKTNIYIGLSLLMQLLMLYSPRVFGAGLFGVVMLILSTVFYFYGVYCYAKGKGYSGWLTFLGCLHLLGLLILVVLPDHRKQG